MMLKHIQDSAGRGYMQTPDGTCYADGTSEKIIDLLQRARANRWRVRLFYGDTKTGRDWLEEHDVLGRVGRSTGSIKIPLIIHNERSIGGTAILTQCIVKITIDKRTVYQHPRYYLPAMAIRPAKAFDAHPSQPRNLTHAVYVAGKAIANFESLQAATRYRDFLEGTRNKQ